MRYLSTAIAVCFTFVLSAQIFQPIKITHEIKDLGNDEYELIFTGEIDDEWATYSHYTEEGGPIPTSIFFDEPEKIKPLSDIVETGHKKEGKDKMFEDVNVIKFLGDEDYTISQKIKVLDNTTDLTGYLDYMTCNDERCLKDSYDFTIAAAGVSSDTGAMKIEGVDLATGSDMVVNDKSESKIFKPVTWNIDINPKDGDTYTITYTADIAEGWTVYSQETAEDGPVATEIIYDEAAHYSTIGASAEQGKRKEGYDKLFEVNVIKYLADEPFVITQDVKVSDPDQAITGYLTYMACDAEKCLPPTSVDFNLFPNKEAAAATSIKIEGNVLDQKIEDLISTRDNPISDCEKVEAKDNSIWGIFLGGFLGGLFAILLPCIFPMIPITVSFFSKDTKRKGWVNGLIYGLSIIGIFVTIGLLITAALGPEALNRLSTNWIANTIFFLIFIAFAISFFGYYEIALPSSWSTKSDQMADKGGLLGTFFMAATLAIVSFSCTGPIIGTALVQVASQGSYLGPAAVMLGFSTALALPFGLFAAFPAWLNSLPKSGGWMTSLKVVLGFLELALAFKFLSVADMTSHWGLLRYELFMGIIILIFAAMTLYLFGYIRFPHDGKITKLGPLRSFFAISSLVFTLYLCTGFMINDETKMYAATKVTSGIAPPAHYNYFLPSQKVDPEVKAKYPSFTKCANNIDCFKDYYEGLAYAREEQKPILLDFTGYGCVNCRNTEEFIWVDSDIRRKLNNDFVLISLYVDDDTKLDEMYVSKERGDKIRNIGNKWADFQIINFAQNSQPLYVPITPDEQVISSPRGYESGIDKYETFLNCSLDAFEKMKS